MKTIEQALKVFQDEVSTATWAFYTWKSINNAGAKDKDIRIALNRNPAPWNVITHSLQSTFFITLGRLFDIDGDAFSVHAFVRFCIENIDQFGANFIRDRKMEGKGDKEPDWLEEYIEGIYIATEDDLQRLRGEVSKHQIRYENIYRPIRNKVMAHKEMASMSNVSELFGKTNIGEIEEFLNLFFQIERIAFDLMHNGKLNKIGHYEFTEEQRMKEDVVALLDKIKA